MDRDFTNARREMREELRREIDARLRSPALAFDRASDHDQTLQLVLEELRLQSELLRGLAEDLRRPQS